MISIYTHVLCVFFFLGSTCYFLLLLTQTKGDPNFGRSWVPCISKASQKIKVKKQKKKKKNHCHSASSIEKLRFLSISNALIAFPKYQRSKTGANGDGHNFYFSPWPPISPSPLSLLRSRVCCPELVYMPKFLRLTLLKYCHHMLIPVNLLHSVITLLVSRRKRLVFLPSRPTAHIRQVSTNEMVISITPAYPTGNNATWYYDQLVAPRTLKLCGLFFFF